MPAGYAVVPAVGGGALAAATMAALVVDYMDQLALDDGPPLMRYVSIATADTNKWPHWLFVMGCTVFSPSIVVTGLWQAQLAQKNDLAQMLTLFSVFCGVCAILVALIPMMNRVGIILHVVTATFFTISGSMYCTVARDLAVERNNDTVAEARAVFSYGGVVGGALILFSLSKALHGTTRLENHANAPEGSNARLTPTQIVNARRWGAILGTGQVSVGISITLTLASGVIDAKAVDRSSTTTIIAGVVVALGALLLAAAFFAANHHFGKRHNDKISKIKPLRAIMNDEEGM